MHDALVNVVLREAIAEADFDSAGDVWYQGFKRRKYVDERHEVDQTIRQFRENKLVIATEPGSSQVLSCLTAFTTDPLPMDRLWGWELDELRAQGYTIGQAGKLAGEASIWVLLGLMAEVFCYIAQRKNLVVVEINPRHLYVYTKLIGFRLLAPDRRRDPQVRNHPAIGLVATREEILQSPAASLVVMDDRVARFRPHAVSCETAHGIRLASPGTVVARSLKMLGMAS